jgi:ubiquinone/menaquinone biosynthesis C-methylase UbiE
MKTLTNRTFYDSITGFYDSMISFNSNLIKRIDLIKPYIDKGVTNVADLGCGSGIDSIALFKNGLKVTSFDISKKMIIQAKKNAQLYGADIEFINSPLEKIHDKFSNKYDMAVSFGNTLSNLNNLQINSAVKRIFKILKYGSTFIFQILNINFMQKMGKRIVNISKDEEKYYIRFYDFYNNKSKFNILSFARKNTAEFNLLTTDIYPHDPKMLLNTLKNAGFKRIEVFENLTKKKFDPKISNEVVMICRK